MKSIVSLAIIALFTVWTINAQSVKAIVNIKQCTNDKVHVTLNTPTISSEEILYIMPASIPGTYAKMDFGYYVKNFRAYDKTGGFVPVRRQNDNEFLIIGANKLSRIEYDVNDTYDDTTHTLDVFNPGGTNIQADTNIMFGAHGFLGYFNGMQNIPYEVIIIKPASFWGATSLQKSIINDTVDKLDAASYDALVDNPAMYSVPDTISYYQGKTKVSIAVYSSNEKVHADMVAKVIKPVTATVEKFLGTMPVDRYTFMLYFVGDNRKDLRRREAFGALEHNYSSVYFLPEPNDEASLKGWIAQTAVHEFLHILVPLNLHSKEIAHFDFKDPKMSRHLWLYEGVTEYFSLLSRFQSGSITEKQFRNSLRRKIFGSMFMMPKPVAMTELSLKVLQPEYQKMYGVVYEKGALLGLMADITLRESTGDKTTLLSLIRSLTAKYGPNKPFEDAELFSVIEKEAGPAMGTFISTYLDSPTEIPYAELFNKIGWKFSEKEQVKGFSFKGIRIEPTNDTLFVKVRSEDNILGAKNGDILLTINGVKPELDDEENDALSFINSPDNDDELILTVQRGEETLTLKGKPVATEKTEEYHIGVLPDANEQQKALLRSLLTH